MSYSISLSHPGDFERIAPQHLCKLNHNIELPVGAGSFEHKKGGSRPLLN